MMKSQLGLFLLAAVLPAQVSAPRVGFARFAGGSVHAVSGLPANLVVADLPIARADSLSFSDSGGLVAHNGEIDLVDANAQPVASFASGEAAPLLNVDGALTTAIAWLPSSHSILHWDGKSFAITGSDVTGEITGLQRIDPEKARLLVRQTDASVSAVIVSLTTGQVIDSQTVPGIEGRAFAQHSFLVAIDSKTLVVESEDGQRRVLPLVAPDLTIERMSSDWLHVFSASSGEHWALHLTQTDLQLSRMPPARKTAQ
jgi:hypothetical protein